MMASLEKTVRIGNKRGLHARAAAKFVKLVETRKADVMVFKDDMSVCGSSIMGLLMLSASLDTQIRIVVTTYAASKFQSFVGKQGEHNEPSDNSSIWFRWVLRQNEVVRCIVIPIHVADDQLNFINGRFCCHK